MIRSPHFRIYYSGGPTTLVEEVDAGALADAVRRAEAHRAVWRDARYFEIWQDADLLCTSEDHARGRPVSEQQALASA